MMTKNHISMQQKIINSPQPRTIKTHLSYEMLPKEIQQKKPKVLILILSINVSDKKHYPKTI